MVTWPQIVHVCFLGSKLTGVYDIWNKGLHCVFLTTYWTPLVVVVHVNRTRTTRDSMIRSSWDHWFMAVVTPNWHTLLFPIMICDQCWCGYNSYGSGVDVALWAQCWLSFQQLVPLFCCRRLTKHLSSNANLAVNRSRIGRYHSGFAWRLATKYGVYYTLHCFSVCALPSTMFMQYTLQGACNVWK